MAARVAEWLSKQGCRPGDRVVLLAENDAHWCAAFLGILRLGAMAVPLDTAFKPRQIATLLQDSGSGHALVGPAYLPAVREAETLSGSEIEVLLLRGDAGMRPTRIPPCPATADDPAVILYTSGTTSDPKGVVLTHGNLLAEREGAFQVVNVDERDAVLSVLPLFHSLALLANLILPFSVGARVVFLESVNTSELQRAFRDRGISIFCCVPQFFYLIHERVTREVAAAGLLKRSLFQTLLAVSGWLRTGLGVNPGRVFFGRAHRFLGPRMRLLVTGASRFDPGVGRDLFRLGFDILQAYGLTECSGAATVARGGNPAVEGVGPAFPGVELRIRPREGGGEDEENTGPSDGEVLIRGPIVMTGYYNRPDANAATLRDGWLHTGDLGYLDRRGRLHITGRMKDVIVLASGKNIYPEEIEAHYLQSEFIKELCVLGLSREGGPAAERLHAVVVPDLDVMRARKIVNMREQLRWEIEGLAVQVPSHKRILGYDVRLEDLPRTTTRKIKRFEIERQLLSRDTGGDTGASVAVDPKDEAWLAEPHVRQMTDLMRPALRPGTKLFPAANLELDLGLDSMERVELLTNLERALAVKVPEEVAQKIYTVRELFEALHAAPAEGADGASGEQSFAWERLLRDVREDDPLLAGLLKPKKIIKLGMFAALRVVHLLARLLFRFQVSGLERLPERAPFILSPNHQSYLDAFLLVSALPFRVIDRIFFVGASEYFASPFMAWVARTVNIVPVDPDSNLVQAMKAGGYGLRHGMILILFPEGERSIDGTVRTFKKGAAVLSLHLGAPIVPIALEGIYELWPRNRPPRWGTWLPWSGLPARMRLGEPIVPSSPDESPRTERHYAEVTERLRGAVQEMWNDLHVAGYHDS